MQTDKPGFFRETQQLAEEYIRERLLLLKLQTAEKTAKMASVVFAGAIIGVFALIILLLLTALACYFLIEVTGSVYYGIGIIVLFYFILVALLIYFRKALFYTQVANAVIKTFFDETEQTGNAEKDW